MSAGIEMSPTRFAQLVQDALDDVPDEFADHLGNVVIQIEAFDRDDPTILGLYRGVALTDRLSDFSFEAPDTITIYRDPILAMCQSEDEVAHEVGVTVVHEIGHFFGIDDDRLHELGWA